MFNSIGKKGFTSKSSNRSGPYVHYIQIQYYRPSSELLLRRAYLLSLALQIPFFLYLGDMVRRIFLHSMIF